MKLFLINLIFKIFQKVQLLLQHCSERHLWVESIYTCSSCTPKVSTVYFCDILQGIPHKPQVWRPRWKIAQSLSCRSSDLLRPERDHLHFPYLSSAANRVFSSHHLRTSIIPNPSASKYFFIVFTAQKKGWFKKPLSSRLPSAPLSKTPNNFLKTQPALPSLAATVFSCSSSSSFFLYSFRRYSSGSIPASCSSAMALSSRRRLRALCTFRAVMYRVNSLKPSSLHVSTSQIFLTSLLLSTWGKKTKPDIFSRSSTLTWKSVSWWLKPMGSFGTTKAPRTRGSEDVLLLLARITLYRWDGTATSSFPITCQRKRTVTATDHTITELFWSGNTFKIIKCNH